MPKTLKKIIAGSSLVFSLGISPLVTSQESNQSEQMVEVLIEQANQGSVEAQFLLGWFYFTGNDVRQDYAKAKEWFEKAAAQGDAEAQFNLGVMYGNGEGVRQDYVKAREWYEKAAAQGHASAQLNLGTLYYHGEGVRQDYVKAREWFGKACDNGIQVGCDGYRALNNRR